MKKRFILVLIIVLMLAVTGCGSSESDTDNGSYNKSNNNQTNNSTESKQEEQKVELTEYEKFMLKIGELLETGEAFDTGNYIQGDIPAGEYAFVKFNGSGSYYCEKDAAGNIIDNENFDSFGYVKVHAAGNLETRGVLISVSAFEKLGVTGAKEIYEKINDKTDWNQGGYYKVGADIEPGTYVVESMGNGYWAIMSGPVSDSDIIDNDYFKGRSSFTVSNGQYLNLSRVTLSKAE